MQTHVKTLSILWIIYGALGILTAGLTFLFFFSLSLIPEGYEAPIILRTIGIGGGIFIGILSVPEVIAGIGLLKMKEWGRILTLAVAFLNLLWFPLGTALAIYSLVILFNQEAVALFRSSSAAS